MTTFDKTSAEKVDIDGMLDDPLWENLTDIDERVASVLGEGKSVSGTRPSQQAARPLIKGRDILNTEMYSVDLKDTINDMFKVIQSMEGQLERVLAINAGLERDKAEAKALIPQLSNEKLRLEREIEDLKSQFPTIRELQMENDQLVDERNAVEYRIRDLNRKIEKMQKAILEHQKRIGGLEEEKRDAIAEITYLEAKLNAASGSIRSKNRQVSELKGERMVFVEKIKNLEASLTNALDENQKLSTEVTKTQKAIEKLSAAVADKKRKAKRSFYQEVNEKREGPEPDAAVDQGEAAPMAGSESEAMENGGGSLSGGE